MTESSLPVTRTSGKTFAAKCASGMETRPVRQPLRCHRCPWPPALTEPHAAEAPWVEPGQAAAGDRPHSLMATQDAH